MREGSLWCRHHVAAIVGGHCVRKGFWGPVCEVIYLLFYLWVGKVHSGFTGVEESLLVLCFGRFFLVVFPVLFVILKNFSSVTSLLQMPMNARTVTYELQKCICYHRIFRLFGGATKGFKICAGFVGSLCTVAEG